ncbi:MAG: 4a-hydroxytetrahydrobiopterin dehydratase [Polaromonas sp.]|uniref:4a-hydroxytetrahydrobiopterin dehydratase n=1 Tax=Polaromonas sp. TaxID=1869339 RepID=UPI0024871A90|nr:4a-hydroxytetrahydrobiopterin dehydratase [Polaromonas sp.]MDI1268241.1 4a-hydroxytetrahydrobiopterin dehydratase [Polaromonas sp.]MDP1888758.1 4a-hydroxytetrahydrobiopterin dehydratase [Polaromonas sp.]MDP2448359.1 4a-hydroxytetrahydrobiopterin dehydratase [Polaromonas sp.]MDP3247237.1 4a-hydroxytetrahydrobiopterin dehydratase [Polaromonas sp.]MDP3757030.1 4a-hydroxytetrahydrobiopterin dehydratase [Polaromonas sp.]
MSNPIHQNRRALSATEIVTQLSQLNGEQPQGWRLIDGSLEKTFSFKNFHETMGFANAVAFIANAEDHHPDLALSYGKCTVRFNTHDVNGISVSDFFCASQVDALLA